MLLIRRYGKFKLVLLGADFLCFVGGGALSILLLSFLLPVFTFTGVYLEKAIIMACATVLTLISFRYNNLYKFKISMDSQKQIVLLLKHLLWTFVFILILNFLIRSEEMINRERTLILSFLLFSYILIIIYRVSLKRLFPSLQKSELLKRRILAIGAGKLGKHFYAELKENKFPMYDLIGFLDDNLMPDQKQESELPVLGPVDHLTDIIRDYRVDEIFITINNIRHAVLLDLIKKCRLTGCNVNILSNHFGIIEKKIHQSDLRDIEYVTIHTSIKSQYFGLLKRTFDIFSSILILSILFPFLLILAVSIKLTSRGPIFYTPYSIGKHGKQFKFYKFRTMVNNVSNESHQKLVEDFMNGRIIGAKLREDPRVTRLGRFLRKYSLDELAQLINVLKGEMSLIGPRPSTLYEYQMMEDWHKKRFDVLSGMTGLWQVAGRAEVSYIDMIMMDIYYAEKSSFWLDLYILFKTVYVVFKGKGGH